MSAPTELITPSVYAIGVRYLDAQTKMNELRDKALRDNEVTQQLFRDRDAVIADVQAAQLVLDRALHSLQHVRSLCDEAQARFMVLKDEITGVDADLHTFKRQLEDCAATPAPQLPPLLGQSTVPS